MPSERIVLGHDFDPVQISEVTRGLSETRSPDQLLLANQLSRSCQCLLGSSKCTQRGSSVAGAKTSPIRRKLVHRRWKNFGVASPGSNIRDSSRILIEPGCYPVLSVATQEHTFHQPRIFGRE